MQSVLQFSKFLHPQPVVARGAGRNFRPPLVGNNRNYLASGEVCGSAGPVFKFQCSAGAQQNEGVDS